MVILCRVSSTQEEQTLEEQTGVCLRRGCLDQISPLRQILGLRQLYARSTVMVFLEIRAPFEPFIRVLVEILNAREILKGTSGLVKMCG